DWSSDVCSSDLSGNFPDSVIGPGCRSGAEVRPRDLRGSLVGGSGQKKTAPLGKPLLFILGQPLDIGFQLLFDMLADCLIMLPLFHIGRSFIPLVFLSIIQRAQRFAGLVKSPTCGFQVYHT